MTKFVSSLLLPPKEQDSAIEVKWGVRGMLLERWLQWLTVLLQDWSLVPSIHVR